MPRLKFNTNESTKSRRSTGTDGRAGILRITDNGKSVAGGIIGNYRPLDKYFAYGIRNSFGMAFDPLSGNLWDVENGPEFGDEINLVYQASIVDGTKSKAFGRRMRIHQAILRLI